MAKNLGFGTTTDDPPLTRLRKVVNPRDLAMVLREVMAEATRPKAAAERLGVGPAFERTQQILGTPAADSVFALSGGAKPGVFYPGTVYAGQVLDRVKRSGASGREMTDAANLLSLSTGGFYNPLSNRVAFPSSVTPERERDAAIRVGAQKYAIEDEGGQRAILRQQVERARRSAILLSEMERSGVSDTDPRKQQVERELRSNSSAYQSRPMETAGQISNYETAFSTAYNFLTDSARRQNVTRADIDKLAEIAPDAPRLVERLLNEPLFANHPLKRAMRR